jgi:hypothetical protein
MQYHLFSKDNQQIWIFDACLSLNIFNKYGSNRYPHDNLVQNIFFVFRLSLFISLKLKMASETIFLLFENKNEIKIMSSSVPVNFLSTDICTGCCNDLKYTYTFSRIRVDLLTNLSICLPHYTLRNENDIRQN